MTDIEKLAEENNLFTWVKAKNKPTEYGRYLCRVKHPITGERGAEYLDFTSEGFMVEHDDYHHLEWLKPIKAKEAALQPEEKQSDAVAEVTIGQIISKEISFHELNPDVIERELEFPQGFVSKIMNDEVYTNSIPVVLFKNLLQSLHIPFSKIEKVMLPTFELLLSKETADSIKKKPHGYMLWENKESLAKYVTHLREIFKNK